MNYLMLNKDDITEVCGVISKAEVKKRTCFNRTSILVVCLFRKNI